MKNGETAPETPDIKGKGKGKGKGKSNLVQSKPLPAEDEELAEEKTIQEVTPDREKKSRKSATEIYHSLLKATPESGDEDSEDSEDEEFGGGWSVFILPCTYADTGNENKTIAALHPYTPPSQNDPLGPCTVPGALISSVYRSGWSPQRHSGSV